MFGFGVLRPENVTLLDGPNHTCHIKSQSFKVAYDKAIITKWLTGKMGYIALPIWMKFISQKAVKGQAVTDFLAEQERPSFMRISQTRSLKFV